MRRRVVITGAGVVSPIGTGVQAFQQGLRQARAGVDTIRSFDASSFASRVAGEVTDLDADAVVLDGPEAHGLRRDAKSLYGLVAAREALARADLGRAPYPARRLGLFVSAGLEIFHLPDLVAHAAGDGVDGAALLQQVMEHPPLSRLQLPADLGARAMAREAGAEGYYSVNVSACAAGTQSLGEALLAVREGVVDAALAGGYDSMVNPLGVGGFTLLGALSTANELRGGASRPFDAGRDGFVLGEGAAMFVLEELAAARRRGAQLLAEVLGYGSTMDAYRVTDPAPDNRGTVAAMARALDDAELSPADIDHVNAHGTGTPKNDPAETAAIRAVFGAQADRLLVCSTKSQIGHLIGAAGAVELLAALFALEHQLVPATINLHQPDPRCDLDYVRHQPRPARVRAVLCNSFGFGGQNACLVVGQPPGQCDAPREHTCAGQGEARTSR